MKVCETGHKVQITVKENKCEKANASTKFLVHKGEAGITIHRQ